MLRRIGHQLANKTCSSIGSGVVKAGAGIAGGSGTPANFLHTMSQRTSRVQRTSRSGGSSQLWSITKEVGKTVGTMAFGLGTTALLVYSLRRDYKAAPGGGKVSDTQEQLDDLKAQVADIQSKLKGENNV